MDTVGQGPRSVRRLAGPKETHTVYVQYVHAGGYRGQINLAVLLPTCNNLQVNCVMSQEPVTAEMWRRRREENDLAAAADPLFKKRKFDVHDLKQVIASKGLHTEDIRCLGT